MTVRFLTPGVVLALLLLASMSVVAQEIIPGQIWIFDTNAKPVRYKTLSQRYPIQHFNLDRTKKFEQQFSLGLSGSSKVATEQALQRIQKLTPVQLEQFKQSYTGIVTAWKMGVRQLPAVVFEYQGQQFVTYGQQQASSALQEFVQWQKNH